MPEGDSVAIAAGPDKPMDALFLRELAEVYLLIDHISSNCNKRLPVKLDLDGDGVLDKRDWMTEICELTWPPRGDRREVAHQAVFLIRIRDALNRLASPATGASIAFTIMTGYADVRLASEDSKNPSVAEGLAANVEVAPAGRESSPGSGPAHGESWPVHDTITGLTRYDLATRAFPNLRGPAKRFARFNRGLVAALLVWLLVTLGLSWNVATGSNLLSQLHTARVEYQDATKAVTPRPPGAPSAEDPHLQYLRDRYTAARANLSDWARGWQIVTRWPWQWDERVWSPGRSRTDVGRPAVADPDQAGAGAISPALWAASLNNVLGNSVLPACYGLLGALAARLRIVWRRIRDSVLGERDLLHSLIQVALGAVIGACIGLFVTPSGGDGKDAAGLLGTATISASALCFLAGFGVEHVFKALEAILTRVFTIPTASPKAGDNPLMAD
jgi:hypothetical protein